MHFPKMLAVIAAMFVGSGWYAFIRPVAAATPAQQQTETWMAAEATRVVNATYKPTSVVVKSVNLANLNVVGTFTRKLPTGTTTYGWVVSFKVNAQRQLVVDTIRSWKL